MKPSVRVGPHFSELDAQLGETRGPDGEPSASDFLLVELPTLSAVFAERLPAYPRCGREAAIQIEQTVAMTTDSGPQEFEGATFSNTSFKGATMRACDLSGVRMRSVEVDGLDIDGQDLLFGRLFVNGVDVVPFVDAELNQRFPGRELQTAQSPGPARWLGCGPGSVGDDAD